MAISMTEIQTLEDRVMKAAARKDPANEGQPDAFINFHPYRRDMNKRVRMMMKNGRTQLEALKVLCSQAEA